MVSFSPFFIRPKKVIARTGGKQHSEWEKSLTSSRAWTKKVNSSHLTWACYYGPNEKGSVVHKYTQDFGITCTSLHTWAFNLWVGPGFKFLFLPKIKLKSRYCVVTDSIYQACKISPKSGLVRSREHPPLTTRFSYLSFLFIFLFHDYSLLRS